MSDYETCQRAILAAGGKKILIFAGTSQQAWDWAGRAGLAPHDWRYVRDPYDTRGRRGNPYVILGTFYDRRDQGEMRDMIVLMGFVQIEGVDAHTWSDLVIPDWSVARHRREIEGRQTHYAPGEAWFE